MSTAVYLDTNALISAFESSGERAQGMWDVLDAIAAGEFRGVTSELTLAEVLPKPLSMDQGDLSQAYQDALSSAGFLDVIPVTRPLLILTAELRSRSSSLKLPDAVHLATAIQERCTVLLSDDRRLPLPASMVTVRLRPHSLREIRQVVA